MSAERGARRVQLSRELIVETALRLATEEPGRKLTTVRLGTELGADPTAIYRHFRSRDDLLLAVADEVYGECLRETGGGGDPLERIRDLLVSIRAAFLRRPALAVETLPQFLGGPSEREVVDRIASWFRASGLSRTDAFRQVRALGEGVLGLTISAAGTFILDERAIAGELAAANQLYPVAARSWPSGSAAEQARADTDTVFETFIDTYLAGLRARAVAPGAVRELP